jgi:uncharacterized protein (DUF486 family)
MMNAVTISLQTVLLLTASNVFMTVACMDQPFKLDFLWAGLCMVGPVHLIFRS